MIWDHSNTKGKFTFILSNSIPQLSQLKQEKEETGWVIISFENTLEIEVEIRLRMKSYSLKEENIDIIPNFQYIGVYAGESKPKPFQRKRPSLLPSMSSIS